jgi:hypothetical protein
MSRHEDLTRSTRTQETEIQLNHLVEVAMQRVREGDISFNQIQRVLLSSNDERKLYLITDTWVMTRLSDSKVISLGDPASGLFVDTIEINENGVHKRGRIELSRSKLRTTRRNNLFLSERTPSELEILASDIEAASKIPLHVLYDKTGYIQAG